MSGRGLPAHASTSPAGGSSSWAAARWRPARMPASSTPAPGVEVVAPRGSARTSPTSRRPGGSPGTPASTSPATCSAGAGLAGPHRHRRPARSTTQVAPEADAAPRRGASAPTTPTRRAPGRRRWPAAPSGRGQRGRHRGGDGRGRPAAGHRGPRRRARRPSTAARCRSGGSARPTGRSPEPGTSRRSAGSPSSAAARATDDLITVRGRALLAAADVVVVDRLGPRGLLATLGPDVEVVDVGKTPGNHPVTQGRINEILVEHARRGRPSSGSRAATRSSSAAAARRRCTACEHGVPVEVVPGVTSAVSVPAAAGHPRDAPGHHGVVRRGLGPRRRDAVLRARRRTRP